MESILQHFTQDKLYPRAIWLEYLPNTESLTCVEYSDALYPQAIEGMQEIHRAGVHHQDIYPKNLCWSVKAPIDWSRSTLTLQ